MSKKTNKEDPRLHPLYPEWAQTLPEDTTDMRERVIWVISETGASGRDKYTWLEKRTGINARKWKNVCNRLQQPSVEMIAALATQLRPHFLTWMVTGEACNVRQVNPTDENSIAEWIAHQVGQLSELTHMLNEKRKE